jgi:hypothetical protein
MMEQVNTPDTMTTSSQVLELLRRKHMDNEFRWTSKGFKTNNGKTYRPEDLLIIRTLRFEGVSDPSDMEILYIIKTNDGLVGYSLDAYGAYSSHESEYGYNNFIRQIPQSGHEEQLLFTL